MRILFLIVCLLVAGCRSQREFDRERWLDADLETRERAHMVASLFEQHPLRGMDRAEVVSLLGPPTPTEKWGGTEMIYVLGPDGGLFAIDHEWLLIELDDHDRVSSYRVVSD